MEKLESFYHFLNSLNLDLNFTMKVRPFVSTVYTKSTDSHLYLHAKSCHKASSIRSIQKGVALCLRRISSTDNECLSKPIEYQDYLNRRGHDPKKVHDTFGKISKLLEMTEENRWQIVTITVTDLFFRQNLIPEYQMSPKQSTTIFIYYKTMKF